VVVIDSERRVGRLQAVESLKLHTRPIRVTFVIGSLAVGGAETQLVRLVNNLDRQRFTPSVICLWRGGELAHTLSSDVTVSSIDLSGVSHRFIRSRAILAIRILAKLAGSLRRQEPDVVHAYLPTAYVLGALAARLLGVRVIVAGRRGLTSIDIYGSARWRTLARIANRVIDVHVCNSRAVRDYAIANEGISIERTRVIYNGIDLPQPTPSPQLPSEWGLAGTSAAMVANLIRYKGHREVLFAMARIVRRHPLFRLVLMGDGPERTALSSLVRELNLADHVVFAGALTDASNLVREFDFTILGSSEEGFPNALMESMAVGVPVVATAVGGVPELVEDGVHGRLVPYGDREAMATAIEWMIEHPKERHEMGERARLQIAHHFSTDRMVKTTSALYAELLARHRRQSPG